MKNGADSGLAGAVAKLWPRSTGRQLRTPVYEWTRTSSFHLRIELSFLHGGGDLWANSRSYYAAFNKIQGVNKMQEPQCRFLDEQLSYDVGTTPRFVCGLGQRVLLYVRIETDRD